MEVIAKTANGVMLIATEAEVRTILKAVSVDPGEIKLGTKVPAIDYAGSISKIKSLADDYSFKNLINNAESFHAEIMKLKTAVLQAAESI